MMLSMFTSLFVFMRAQCVRVWLNYKAIFIINYAFTQLKKKENGSLVWPVHIITIKIFLCFVLVFFVCSFKVASSLKLHVDQKNKKKT